MKIGVITDCFKIGVDGGIRLASELGLAGVQIYATTGEFSPEVLTDDRIAYYKELLAESGLEISALCGDMGGFGFERECDNGERVEKTKRIIDLANALGTHVVTTHIGVIPEDKENPRYATMLRALTECGVYAKDHGVTLAIETGPEKASILLAFLKDTKGGVGVNLDPANFTMVTGQDATEAVYMLADYIVHTHAKDGVMLHRGNPEYIYGVVHPVPEEFQGIQYFAEVPLGQGNVHFDTYMAALDEIGYKGFLTIERECGNSPEADIRLAVEHLNAVMGK